MKTMRVTGLVFKLTVEAYRPFASVAPEFEKKNEQYFCTSVGSYSCFQIKDIISHECEAYVIHGMVTCYDLNHPRKPRGY